jgi:cytochrome P450
MRGSRLRSGAAQVTKVDLPGTLLLDPRVIEDPYPFYRQLREDAPVWEASATGLFTVSTFELVAEVTSRVEDFSSNITRLFYKDDAGLPCRVSFGEDVGQVLATADPPTHALHRGTVFPELVAKRMETLESDVVEIANACIDEALADATVDYMGVVANIVPITMISRLIGFQDSDLDQLLQAAFDSTEMLGGTLSLDALGALMARSLEVQTYIAGQLSTAMQAPGDDLLGAVARGLSDDVFEEPGARVMLQTLLSAGGESTTSLLGNSVRILAEGQRLQEQLRSDPNLIPNFVEEALRVESPFRFHMRSTSNDTTLGDVHIPAESTLLLLWGSANRDPAEFNHPDQIDLERPTPRHHVGFGRGMHHCVGAPLARMEARVVLTALLERTERIELDPNDTPQWVDSLMVRRHARLPVQLSPR